MENEIRISGPVFFTPEEVVVFGDRLRADPSRDDRLISEDQGETVDPVLLVSALGADNTSEAGSSG